MARGDLPCNSSVFYPFTPIQLHMNQEPSRIIPVTRRSFLRRTGGLLGAAAVASALDPSKYAFSQGSSEELKIALVGCGGRGSGAVMDALSNLKQGPLKIVAMADVFEDKLKGALG